MIQRTSYLNELISWKDQDIIKVIRRCGKSTLLKQYQDHLKGLGIHESQIISINFEDLQFEQLLEYHALYSYILSNIIPDQKMYIFLDEVQKVKEFEKAVDSLYIQENIDIYITSSHECLLSKLFYGRAIEISMLPLSFKEVYQKGTNQDEAFIQYLKYGDFPYLSHILLNEEKANTYIEGIYNTVIVKDIEEREARKQKDPNKRNINNLFLLTTIAKYLASTIGSIISIKNVTGYITSTGRKVSPNTVDHYMQALKESFIFYPVERFDIAGKKIIKS
ncbi:hypothetical protein SG0102_28400 [Intestinibaculum porci]|uniref:AAA domain-containing protein n=1 Tax=Intestinibaculum porci TaxID=2487118 RepID=A0A3G9JBG2_9FIRM|nr:AAA family ATPase [Intestinibaculum porci]BBH27906.1 hypothetical protein SG0102_28400 [Intestinibaculum porci]